MLVAMCVHGGFFWVFVLVMCIMWLGILNWGVECLDVKIFWDICDWKFKAQPSYQKIGELFQSKYIMTLQNIFKGGGSSSSP